MTTLYLTRHAADKLAAYNFDGDRLCLWPTGRMMVGWSQPIRPMNAQ